MSAVMEHTTAPKYVQTLMEVSFVNVIVAIYWILMELLVMDAYIGFTYKHAYITLTLMEASIVDVIVVIC